jgi:hypothetical protein
MEPPLKFIEAGTQLPRDNNPKSDESNEVFDKEV